MTDDQPDDDPEPAEAGSDDPFADFETPEDGDPFEDLGGPDDTPDDATVDESVAPGSDPDSDPSAAEPAGYDPDTGEATYEVDEEAPTEDPFASFSGPDTDPGGSVDSFGAFEEVDVGETDPDQLWESLSAAEDGDGPDFEEKVFSEVSKHRFCENCEHFSGPPDTHCTYEGAAIVEFLDMETVRLVNCPIVAEQRELEEETGN